MSTILPLFLALALADDSYQARVVSVSDGDTIGVLAAGSRQVRIRLAGVDAPESGQAFGAAAKQFASDLAFGQVVTIRGGKPDRFGRTVATVVLPDGRDLGSELVLSGMGWWYRAFAPDDRELARAEGEAREARRGLWIDPQPTPPWLWRRDGGSPVAASTAFVGNRNSMVYHKADCRSVGRTKPENRMAFKSEVDAVRAGFKKAQDCR